VKAARRLPGPYCARTVSKPPVLVPLGFTIRVKFHIDIRLEGKNRPEFTFFKEKRAIDKIYEKAYGLLNNRLVKFMLQFSLEESEGL
jgi:hypothetical protein